MAGLLSFLRSSRFKPRPSSNPDWRFERLELPGDYSKAELEKFLPSKTYGFSVAGILWIQFDYGGCPYFSNGEEVEAFVKRMTELESNGTLPVRRRKDQGRPYDTIAERRYCVEHFVQPDNAHELADLTLHILLVSPTGREFDEWFHTDRVELEALQAVLAMQILNRAKISGDEKPNEGGTGKDRPDANAKESPGLPIENRHPAFVNRKPRHPLAFYGRINLIIDSTDASNNADTKSQ